MIWLSAEAGSGKTALARSYAQHEQRPCLLLSCESRDRETAFCLAGLSLGLARWCGRQPAELPQFAADGSTSPRDGVRRLFDAVIPWLPNGAFLVLDDVHALGQGAMLADVLVSGLARFPPGRNALVLSRGAAPAELAVLRSQGQAACLDARSLALRPDELAVMAQRRGHEDVSPQTLDFLQRTTCGWMTGVLLQLDQFRLTPEATPVSSVFDYFSIEVIPRMSRHMLSALCEISRLPSITQSLVEQLRPGAGMASVLDELVESHGFVTRSDDAVTYAVHPMFRDVLRQYALSTLGEQQVRAMTRRIAGVLWAQGWEDEAAALFLEQDLLADLVRRLPSIFPDLLTDEQRVRTQNWLRVRLEQRGPQPWQDCWMGLCQLVHAPAEGREALQRAYAVFVEGHDAMGAVCALTGIVESFINQWGDFHPLDRWIPELSRMLDAGLMLPEDVAQRAHVALFTGMMYRQPGNSGLPSLAAEMQRVVERCGREPLRAYAAAQLLLYQCWWRGDMIAGRLILELAPGPEASEQQAPAVRIAWLAVQSVHRGMMCADPAEPLSLLETGLALAERSDVHLWDSLLLGQSLWCALTGGKTDAARDYARRMARSLRPGRHLDHSYYHFLNSILAWHEGDPAAMRAHAHAALRCARDAGVPWAEGVVLCAVARAQALQGDTSAARISLDEAQTVADHISSDTVRFDVLLSRLELGQHRCDPDATLTTWAALWRKCGFINFPWWRRASVAALCAQMLALGVETDFTLKMIRVRRLPPPTCRPVPHSWLLPVQIRVMGEFAIEIDGQLLAAEGKIPKRPLALLKLLIALGGQACKTRLASTLWPHLSDAAGEQVLKVTLHRLRGLIGRDCIVCQGGRVSVDENHCRVDLLGFNRSLAAVEAAPAPQWDPLRGLLQQYAAGLFADETHAQWAVGVREQLRTRLQQCLHACVLACIAEERWQELATCCRQGLGLDARDEVCHLGLIEACLELGRPRDAQEAYRHCIDLIPAGRASSLGATIHARLGSSSS